MTIYTRVHIYPYTNTQPFRHLSEPNPHPHTALRDYDNTLLQHPCSDTPSKSQLGDLSSLVGPSTNGDKVVRRYGLT